MPLGPGGLDSNGIWQYGEDDSEALASDLLNLGMQSVSDTIAALGGGFDASTTITATDASWSVPALGNPIVKVTVIGGGGGGGRTFGGGNGGTGGTTTFNAGAAGSISATGGTGGVGGASGSVAGVNGSAGFSAGNGGGGYRVDASVGGNGNGGRVSVAYLDLTGISTVNVTIGAGGANSGGNAGGRGEVIVEYVAG